MQKIIPFLWFDTQGTAAPSSRSARRSRSRVSCETQDEVDRYWGTLSEGGEEGPCGWLKDRFGPSWQVVPTALPRLLTDPDREKSQRVMAAMMKMGKLDIAELEAAAAA